MNMISVPSDVLFNGLTLRPYQIQQLLELHKKYSFVNKIVLEIGGDEKLQVAEAIRRLGAKEIVVVNPMFQDTVQSPHASIIPIRVAGENTPYPDGYFEIIFGIALLEHVHNPRQLADECRRLLRKDAICYLQGLPVWTACHGHHTTLKNVQPGCVNYTAKAGGVIPYENWEHLHLDTNEKVVHALRAKGIPPEHIQKLASQLLHHPHISRLTPTQIVSAFKNTEGMSIQCFRKYSKQKQNKYYTLALGLYSKIDLDTEGIRLFMRHKTNIAFRIKAFLTCFCERIARCCKL